MSGTERKTHCPNCNQEGEGNYSWCDLPFEEWECNNDNCRVSLYEVRSVLADTDRSEGKP